MVAEGQERLSCPVCLRSYSRSSALSVLTPEGTELERVERWESHALVMPYNAQKRRVCEELGFTWTREDVESWLSHGTDAVDAVGVAAGVAAGLAAGVAAGVTAGVAAEVAAGVAARVAAVRRPMLET